MYASEHYRIHQARIFDMDSHNPVVHLEIFTGLFSISDKAILRNVGLINVVGNHPHLPNGVPMRHSWNSFGPFS